MESDQDQHQQAADLCQQVPPQHSQHQTAITDLQRQPLGQIQPTSLQPGSEKDKMGMDRPHPADIPTQHHKAGEGMESPKKEESGQAKEDLEKNCRGRGEGRRMDVEKVIYLFIYLFIYLLSGKAKEDLEKNCRGRGEGRRMDVGSAEGDGPEPSPMARCCCGPVLVKGAKRNKSF